MSPLRDVVVGLLFLEALENYLVLSCDLHKISLAGFSIETLFKLKGRGTRHSCHLLGLCDPHGSSYGVQGAQVSVGVGDALWVLQNIRHLLEEDAVLPLNLGVSLYQKLSHAFQVIV